MMHCACLLANSGLCVNIEFEIWLLLGVNVATTLLVSGSVRVRVRVRVTVRDRDRI